MDAETEKRILREASEGEWKVLITKCPSGEALDLYHDYLDRSEDSMPEILRDVGSHTSQCNKCQIHLLKLEAKQEAKDD